MSSSVSDWVTAVAMPVVLCGPLLYCGVHRVVRRLRAANRLCEELVLPGRPLNAHEREVVQAQMVAHAERVAFARYEQIAALYEKPVPSESRS